MVKSLAIPAPPDEIESVCRAAGLYRDYKRVRAARVIVLSLLLFAGAFGTHEVMHLVVIYAVGGHGSVVVRPWRLGLFDYSIYALHAQPAESLGLMKQALVNLLGPTLAAIPLVALLLAVRETNARAALLANIAILGFYALIETGDYLLESGLEIDVPLLTTPEFNYGVPAVIILLAAALALRRPTARVGARSG
jgi:hypothetical protein